MSATLVCRCGERLRAPPGPAGSPVTCPTCGAVAEPPAAPPPDAAAEPAAPILARIKRRRKDPNAVAPSVWVSLQDGSFTAPPPPPPTAGKPARPAPAPEVEVRPRRSQHRW